MRTTLTLIALLLTACNAQQPMVTAHFKERTVLAPECVGTGQILTFEDDPNIPLTPEVMKVCHKEYCQYAFRAETCIPGEHVLKTLPAYEQTMSVEAFDLRMKHEPGFKDSILSFDVQ